MRVTEGEHVKITLINSADSKHSHSIHMHSIHASGMDGVDRPVPPGQTFIYDFIAQPAGVYPYHCHVDPIADHINRGLYGMMIIDPKTPRPQMSEMVMLMNGYDLDYDQEGLTTIRAAEVDSDSTSPERALEIEESVDGHNDTYIQAITNQTAAENDGGGTDDDTALISQEGGAENKDDANDENGALSGIDDITIDDEAQESAEVEEEEEERDNEIYTVNGEAFLYMYDPIKLQVGKTYRVFLVNMLEFDLINSLHIHGAMFDYYPSGTSETPAFQNDIITLSQGDRGILEFQYLYPGHYMFHAHQTEFTDLGWMGFFDVESASINQSDSGSSTGAVETPQHPHNPGDSEL
jgi:FtsP/CotA-like multicopper oxidase with cupredoxin domain